MYSLTLHIEYLLLRHDCVVVPGMGAFINVRHAARFDEEAGVWYPMTREVRFNPALSHDDGLLANSYARKLEVSFEEGRDALLRDIRQLRQTLEEDGEVTVGHLGILSLSEGTLSFVPLKTPERWAAMLGRIKAPVARKSVIRLTETEIPVSAEKHVENPAPIRNEESARRFDTTRNYYIAINKVFARTAACFVIVAAVALSLLLPGGVGSGGKQIDQASVVPVETIIRNTKTRIAERIEAAKPAKVEEHIQAVPEKHTARYHVIVATFRTHAEADAYVAANASTGYDLQVVSTATKSRVSAMSSDNKEELQRKLTDDGFRHTFSESWIWDAE